MKSYLDLIPISGKVHRRQNRMTVFCIILSVFLITGIFGMADIFIRSQIMQAKKDDGNWHIALRYITDEQAALIGERLDVESAARYGVRNYSADMEYTLGGKNLILGGFDEACLYEMFEDTLLEGFFPKTDTEVLVCQRAKGNMGLQAGDAINIGMPDGRSLQFTVTGFIRDSANLLKHDSYAVAMTTEAMRKWLFPDKTGDNLEDYNSLLYVKFANPWRLQSSIEEIKKAFGLEDKQITENLKLTGLLGQSGSTFMRSTYAAAGVLAVLVMLAGSIMISGSLSSSIAPKTEFYGMIRCIGATPGQVRKLVRREALSWCRFAIPTGLFAAMVTVWILCNVLRFLSPDYFGAMPVFAISFPGLAAGVIIGLATVLIAAHSPAKRASKVSPLAAVSGNSNTGKPVRKAANTMFCKIETALGIHHATASKRNFFLMSGSFALSIVLFLAFSVTVTFMHNALTPLQPWTPDLSVISSDNSLSIETGLLYDIQQNPSVERAYGRRFAYGVPLSEGNVKSVDLISYEENQFGWAEDYLLHDSRGAVETVQEQTLTGLTVYRPNQDGQLETGDTVSLTVNGRTVDIRIVGMLSQCQFDNTDGSGIIICSEETFEQITGQENYTIIDMQLKRNASETDVEAVREISAANKFSDQRLGNRSVQGAYYSFSLCVYGFLALIALITLCNIVNSIALSVAARTRQYGTFRAIGLTNKQLAKVVVAEASAYAAAGSVMGLVSGLACNKILFDMLIRQKWGSSWSVPWLELGIIVFVVLFSVAIAVRKPIKRLHAMSIVDNISAQ